MKPDRMGAFVFLRYRFDARRLAALVFAALCAGAIASGCWLIRKWGITSLAVELSIAWFLTLAVLVRLCSLRKLGLAIAWIALVGIGARFVLLASTNGAIPPIADPFIYWEAALNLARGGDYIQVMEGQAYRAAYPPLYPLLLAAFISAKATVYAPAILNTLIDMATAGLVYRSALLWTRKHLALFAAGAYFIWPHIIIGDAIPQKEGLATFLVLGCFFIASIMWQTRPTAKLAVAYGAISGLLALCQPAFLPLAGIWLLLILYFRHRSAWLAGCTLTGLALVLAPWIFRNWLVFHAFVPLTTSSGINLYMNATSQWIPTALYALPEPVISAKAAVMGLGYILQHPLEFALHTARNFYIGMTLEAAYTQHYQRMQASISFAAESISVVMQASLILIWTASALAFWNRKSPRFFILILGGIALQLVAIDPWFEFGQRHRAFLLPILLVMIAASRRNRLHHREVEHQRLAQ